MKEHWKERVSKIVDSDERRLLRDVLSSAFSNIEDYTNSQLEAIKQRVFEESKVDNNNFDIYTSVVSIDDYDPINDFLFPMDVNDLVDIPFDATVITERSVSGEKPILGKLYFELDYLELSAIKKTLPQRTFKGQLKTNRHNYEIEVSLAPYLGYLNQIEKLYQLHLENKIPWKTVLHPSIHKFMQMQLETTIAFDKQEKVEEIIINFEELDVHKQINQIPLWNVVKKPFSNQGFSIPTGDGVYYEHFLPLDDEVREMEYLVDSNAELNGIVNVRLNIDRLVLLSSKDIITNWRLWTIIKPLATDLAIPKLMSNRKRESFIDNYSMKSGRTIRTVGEIYRIAHLFVSTTSLKLVDHELGALADNKNGINEKNEKNETYPLNLFVKDEIRIEADKKVMKLKFTTDENTPFTRDIMSFIVAEIALYFPEYRCVGELK